MNQLPIPPDTVLDRVLRASKELAEALAAYRRLQARFDEERATRRDDIPGAA